MVYGLLSHNHLLQVLLCWLNGAVWNLNEEDRKCLIDVLDADGSVELQAAVVVDKSAELHATMQ